MEITTSRLKNLSSREKQCLYWAGQDKTLNETAEELNLSSETVRTHRKVLLQKLNCRTMTGALSMALKEGML